MSIKRMFSRVITDSTRFITLPLSSQALYFHLCQHADDDGVVEALGVIRMIGSNDDDFHLLVNKRLITVLNDDYVTFIKDWLEHNTIRADRKIDSIYQELLIKVDPEAKIRVSGKCQSSVSQVSVKCQSDDGQVSVNVPDKCQTNVSIEQNSIEQNSIEQDSIEQDSIEQDRTEQNRTEQNRTESVPVAASPSIPSYSDLLAIADQNGVNITHEGIKTLQGQIESENGLLYGKPVDNLLRAVRGWLKGHPEYQRKPSYDYNDLAERIKRIKNSC